MKASLRKTYLNRRSALKASDRHEKSQEICQYLAQFVRQEGIPTCFLYAAYRDEPDLGLFCVQGLCSLALPVIIGPTEIEFRRFAPGDVLALNGRSISEPLPSAPVLKPTPKDLMIVPAVALDRNGNRLGYGGGFYDRYLKGFPDTLVVGVVFEACIAPRLPVGEYDQGVDYILTEKGLVAAKSS